tara:strand:- start:2653 stop:2997 length:345 start_codon:yes stop_codon:yes gene_type:complete
MENKTKLSKTQITKRRYRHSEKGYKTHRIDQWRNKYGIICDYDKIYDIFINTTNCDHCNCELQSIQLKVLSARSRTLDHCHSCGAARGILCNICNLQNKLSCELCDIKCDICNK